MRLCRFRHQGRDLIGFYFDTAIVPLNDATVRAIKIGNVDRSMLDSTDLMEFLQPGHKYFFPAQSIAKHLATLSAEERSQLSVSSDHVEFLVPIPRPNKLFLLAGNYGDHIQEGGGIAPERAETFPYVFMKPPSTTLIAAGKPILIPKSSPSHVDWELELAVVIGRRGKHIPAAKAGEYIAGYTVINDVSDRQYRPNPGRKPRDKDSFFDWQHGKWHDSFCPCGPCITSADAIPDPQKLAMKLSVNGTVRQNGSTGQQIFPVAAVVEFLSQSVTLEPGDIISTGTPAGVGHSTKTYLKPGDRVDAWIESIGTLTNPVAAE